MAVISYSRKPLQLLLVGGSSPDEVLEFLNRYSDWPYELAEPLEELGETIFVRSATDRTTTRGLLSSTVVVHDPHRGGVD